MLTRAGERSVVISYQLAGPDAPVLRRGMRGRGGGFGQRCWSKGRAGPGAHGAACRCSQGRRWAQRGKFLERAVLGVMLSCPLLQQSLQHGVGWHGVAQHLVI